MTQQQVINFDEFLNNPPFPCFAQFETNTVCNANCLMCPHDKMQKRDSAKWSLLTKIIRETAPNVDACCPFLMQEPMLEPRLASILANLKQHNPQMTTIVYSNMSILHRDFEQIIKDGLLDELHISFYGPTEQLYKKWQPPLKRADTILNIKKAAGYRLKHKRTKPKLILHVLSVPEIIEAQQGYKDVAPYVDTICNVQYDTFHGDVPDLGGNQTRYMGEPKPRTPCQRLWTGINIHCNGNVVPCCIDYKEEYVMGNIHEESLRDIWNNERFNAFRKLHLDGKWYKIPMCKNCKVHEYQFSEEWVSFWLNVKHMQKS